MDIKHWAGERVQWLVSFVVTSFWIILRPWRWLLWQTGFRQGLEASCDGDISVGLEASAVVTDDNTQGLRESCDKWSVWIQQVSGDLWLLQCPKGECCGRLWSFTIQYRRSECCGNWMVFIHWTWGWMQLQGLEISAVVKVVTHWSCSNIE